MMYDVLCIYYATIIIYKMFVCIKITVNEGEGYT